MTSRSGVHSMEEHLSQVMWQPWIIGIDQNEKRTLKLFGYQIEAQRKIISNKSSGRKPNDEKQITTHSADISPRLVKRKTLTDNQLMISSIIIIIYNTFSNPITYLHLHFHFFLFFFFFFFFFFLWQHFHGLSFDSCFTLGSYAKNYHRYGVFFSHFVYHFAIPKANRGLHSAALPKNVLLSFLRFVLDSIVLILWLIIC